MVKDNLKKNYVKSLDFSAIHRYLDLTNFYNSEINIPDFPFRPKAKQYFNFLIRQRYYIGDEEIVKIEFYPKKDKYGAFYSGVIHVNTSTFDLIKIEASAHNIIKPFVKSVNRKDSIVNFNIDLNVQFKKIGEYAFPSYVQFKIIYDYKNSGMAIFNHVETQSTLIHYDYDDRLIALNNVPPDQPVRDYNMIGYNLYLPDFWEKNQVLKASPLEDSVRVSFEKTSSFGKAFNNKDDSLQVTEDGYKIWNKEHRIKINDIYCDKTNETANQSLVLRRYNPVEDTYDTVAALITELFFVFNCYHDSLSFRIRPLFDCKTSFIKAN